MAARRTRQSDDQSPRDTSRHPALRELIAEGISVNVTLLFAQDLYERVAEAYIAGLERHGPTAVT